MHQKTFCDDELEYVEFQFKDVNKSGLGYLQELIERNPWIESPRAARVILSCSIIKRFKLCTLSLGRCIFIKCSQEYKVHVASTYNTA